LERNCNGEERDGDGDVKESEQYRILRAFAGLECVANGEVDGGEGQSVPGKRDRFRNVHRKESQEKNYDVDDWENCECGGWIAAEYLGLLVANRKRDAGEDCGEQSCEKDGERPLVVRKIFREPPDE